ncbi:MAG: tripartite tricarboxylate transporter substrate binding protein [Ottowia sp.]|uniref:Bug family tripartite tricarboxylate transporter substrate binding protein n=1 Tax=Ottowia sp. TaxID=1898956 RepID=UPI003C7477C2
MNRRMLMLLAVALGAAAPAHAQSAYPNKPIRLIIPASAGGPSDVVARLVAEGLTKSLGQPVVVENKPGAAQTLGTAQVAKAEPDGYTLLFTTSTPIVMAPFTRKNLPYDVKKDLIAVSHVGTTPLVLYANSAVPVKSVKELIAAAKAKPGELSYGSYGNGSSAHLLGEYLSKQTGIKLIHVPYAGVSPQITALVGGQIQFAVADIGVPAPFVKDGKLRPLAVTGSQRSASLPEVPTFAEQGVAGMEPFSPWWGLFAPAGTPKAIVDKLSSETVKIVKSTQFKARFAVFGADATGLDSTASTAALNDELSRWSKIFAALPNINFD